MNRRRFLVDSLGGLTVLTLAPLTSFANLKNPKSIKNVTIEKGRSSLTIGYGPRPAPQYSGPDKEAKELPSMLYIWSEDNREFRIPVPFLVHSSRKILFLQR